MKKILVLLVIVTLSSCARGVMPEMKVPVPTVPLGYVALNIQFVQSRQMTNEQLYALNTFISEDIPIVEKIIPESKDSRNLFKVEDGVAVDLEQERIRQQQTQNGYKGDVKKMQKITFVERSGTGYNTRYTYETATGIRIHLFPRPDGRFVVHSLSNFIGVYDDKNFQNTFLLYQYEQRKEQVYEYNDDQNFIKH